MPTPQDPAVLYAGHIKAVANRHRFMSWSTVTSSDRATLFEPQNADEFTSLHSAARLDHRGATAGRLLVGVGSPYHSAQTVRRHMPDPVGQAAAHPAHRRTARNSPPA